MTCDDYLKDPDLHSGHLETCPSCRATLEELDGHVEVRSRPLRIDDLPLAPWESASHRTWPLVAAGAAAVLVLAFVLFLAAGMPPVEGLIEAVTSGVTSVEAVAKFFQLLGSGLHGAPTAVHLTVGVLFVVINAILILLLRRAPRGLDV